MQGPNSRSATIARLKRPDCQRYLEAHELLPFVRALLQALRSAQLALRFDAQRPLVTRGVHDMMSSSLILMCGTRNSSEESDVHDVPSEILHVLIMC